MTHSFHSINDSKYDFIEEIPLRKEIMNAGRRKVIFVEGHDDKIVYGILFSDYSENLYFIDVSLEEAKRTNNENEEIFAEGGCDRVKTLLSHFVSKIPQEKRFYGVIDRDLKQDDEIEAEKNNLDYDKRLFIFNERYTLENYFVTLDVLYEFIYRQSMNHKALIPLVKLGKNKFETDVLNPIETCLAEIGAGNLTIHHFDKFKKFLEYSIEISEIQNRVIQRLKNNNVPETEIIKKLEFFKNFIHQSKSNIHKFASAKLYISNNFRLQIERLTFTLSLKTGKERNSDKVSLQLNKHKSELAAILKEKGLPIDFEELLNFLGCY